MEGVAVSEPWSEVLAELKVIRAYMERSNAALARTESIPTQAAALKRADAAKAMGISRRKLEQLIAAGKVRTAEDPHLVPIAEVKRYCTPKMPKQRKPSVGHRVRTREALDSQSDDAWAEMRRNLRSRAGK